MNHRELPPCQTCDGRGTVPEDHRFGDAIVQEWLSCPHCMGSGISGSTERTHNEARAWGTCAKCDKHIVVTTPFRAPHFDGLICFAQCACEEPQKIEIRHVLTVQYRAQMPELIYERIRKYQDGLIAKRGTELMSGDSFAAHMRKKREG